MAATGKEVSAAAITSGVGRGGLHGAGQGSRPQKGSLFDGRLLQVDSTAERAVARCDTWPGKMRRGLSRRRAILF
ncbi:MAG: hypothetical protein JXR83_08295 [Deltaproteobacteria bacterium]|nr:hypothetical protein [Deltaproteobacteria bacterium]